MKINFLELKPTYLELQEQLDAAYHRVMQSGWYLLGGELEQFEKEFAQYCGAKYCIGVGNGLDALHLVLRAFGVGSGDEVIVPANTFIATWLAVTYAGATPVPVEPRGDTLNIDPAAVRKAITPKTKAIIPVHLYGQPAEITEIQLIAAERGIRVLEDAAQAHGATYESKRIGSHSDASAFSFYPGKNLGAFSDGGAVVTNSEEVFEKVRLLRNYGSKVKYQYEMPGINSRLEELQAAVLREKLKVLDEWNSRRALIATIYNDRLKGIPGLTLPTILPNCTTAWHLYVIQHSQRNEIQRRLTEAGISTLIHYPVPPHLSHAYKELGYGRGAFPISERTAENSLSLPIGPHLSQQDALAVAEKLRQIISCL